MVYPLFFSSLNTNREQEILTLYNNKSKKPMWTIRIYIGFFVFKLYKNGTPLIKIYSHTFNYLKPHKNQKFLTFKGLKNIGFFSPALTISLASNPLIFRRVSRCFLLFTRLPFYVTEPRYSINSALWTTTRNH